MAGRKQKNNELIAWAALALAIGGYVAYVINNHYWAQLALIVLLTLAIPGLAFITQVRTKCLVTFTATGLPCQNPTRGIIFGCRGQNHYWVKALARFGKRQYPARDPARVGGHARLRADGSTAGVVTVRVENDVKNTIMIYTTIVASVCTFALFMDQLRHWLS